MEGLDEDLRAAGPDGLAFIHQEEESAGWTQINLIGHSMGCLVARGSASKYTANIKAVVMIGTPNGGVSAANFACRGCPRLDFGANPPAKRWVR